MQKAYAFLFIVASRAEKVQIFFVFNAKIETNGL